MAHLTDSLFSVHAVCFCEFEHYRMKKVLGETQSLRAGRSIAELNFLPRRTPPSGGAGRPNFNQLEMVTTFIYRPRLVKIDAHNFKLFVVTDPHTNNARPPTHCKHTDRADNNTLHH